MVTKLLRNLENMQFMGLNPLEHGAEQTNVGKISNGQRIPSTHWHRIFKEEQRNAILLYALRGRDGNIWWIAKVTTIMRSLRKFLGLLRNQCRNSRGYVSWEILLQNPP